MGIKQDTEDSLKDFEFTKIDGQPTDEDLNQLTKECINAAASVTTTNGGGRHGHVGMIIDEAEYITFSHNGERFAVPTNPGPFPTTVDENDEVVQMTLRSSFGTVFRLYSKSENCSRNTVLA
jgi:hypothetical protein